MCLGTIASLSGCSTPDRDWNKGIATPTATQLHYQREQAKTSAAGVAAVVAAAIGFQAAGYDPNRPKPAEPPAADPLAPVRGGETPTVVRAGIDQEAATRACTLATEQEARRLHPHALVEAIESVDPLGDGLLVRGTVRLREKKAEPGELRGFRCRVDAQAVRMVAIDAMETRPPR
ncbi:hypothetical protein [uncultured Sphingomonas sp.]|uniref:hypothetical protein n=1 Tax=uncultured Sphingomonas sp. TaxID=158754 RepID=UPI0025D02BD1|nr:hypothetical protein [uncultured Sphingomonas sp.]